MKATKIIILVSVILVSCSKTTDEPNFGEVLDSQKDSGFWFENPENPYEEEVFSNLITSIQYANQMGAQLDCSDDLNYALLSWFDAVNIKYHEIHSFEVMPESLTSEGVASEWFNKIFDAYFLEDQAASINRIVALENLVIQNFQEQHPEMEIEFAAILELTAFLKLMRYTIEEQELILCKTVHVDSIEQIFEWKVDDSYDDCMRRQINNAGFLEIILNWGAGPGGWVAVASADCLIDILSN
jgi:hypothetical protein